MPRVLVRALILVLTIGTALSACSVGTPPPTSPPTGGPTAGSTPAAATAAAPTPSPLGSLAVNVTVQAALDGDLPAGWDVAAEGTLLAFATSGDAPGMVIEMLRNRSVMAADCALEAQKDVATRAEAIIVAIAARPGVAATPPLKARIGGLSGLSIDLGVDQSAGTTCAGDDGGFVPLFGAMESYGWGYAGVGSHERMRLIALDVADNENLVILVTAPDAAAFERHIGAAEAIVKHLAFKVGLAA